MKEFFPPFFSLFSNSSPFGSRCTSIASAEPMFDPYFGEVSLSFDIFELWFLFLKETHCFKPIQEHELIQP